MRYLAWTLAASLTAAPAAAETFADAVAFLKKHTTVVVLSAPGAPARVAVCPDLQGRVMTSASGGDAGPTFGWINRELLASGRKDPHFNAYGGEDRFWLGPEGGQFALFFGKGQPFDLAHWFTPPAIDTEPYPIEEQEPTRVSFRKKMTLANYSGAVFDLELRREVRLVPEADAWKRAEAAAAAGVSVVAFESLNRITNVGRAPWRRETGLVSVWILGMFVPSPATTVVVPFKRGPEATLGPTVNDAYFGKVPADRLVVKDGVLFFRGDGLRRSKIGIPPARALPVLGSYDAKGHVLTLVRFTRPDGATEYVNSMWQLQDAPYGGDVVNGYNDGPPAPGQKPLGPFYELETSSPAAALAPGASLTHAHLTMHFAGAPTALDAIARQALGVGLAEIESAFSVSAQSPATPGTSTAAAPVAASAPTPRPRPPTRDPKAPGFVTAEELPDGTVPSPDVDGNFVIGPTHPPAPETIAQEGVPQGTVYRFTMSSADSKIYPGIARDPGTFGTPDPDDPAKLIVTTSHPAPYTRNVSVYVPRQYVTGTVAPFIVGADGPDPLLFTTLDNLIAQRRVPVMIAISIGNGGGDAQGSERGLEYDTMSGNYAEFVETEVLPLVEKQYDVKLTRDPEGRATMGGSSGGSAALIMAWYRNDLYHRVLAYSITAVNQQWPHDPGTPGGAWEFHKSIIPSSPVKPIRVWLEVGDRDLLNPNVMRDGMHDWVLASENLARVLATKGYHYQFVFARNTAHTERPTKQQTLPEALEYVWKGYPR